MGFDTLMGDEAIALGALHSGLSAAFAYPGTPSTEIMEYLQDRAGHGAGIVAQWCSNEKTAYESALGVSFAGRRAMVSMKHVGLNVAMDPFVNSALLRIKGGLVVVVADDPGMHSSQDEQDSRLLADFAHIPCFEPSDQQEAYDMVREAFDISEHVRCPVMIRLTTRLAHSRAPIALRAAHGPNVIAKADGPEGWLLVPANARRLWRDAIVGYDKLQAEAAARARSAPGEARWGVITSGLALQYYLENETELSPRPARFHIGFFPIPREAISRFARGLERIVVLEDGYPYIERSLIGILGSGPEIVGKISGQVPSSGELDPDNVRPALGLPPRAERAPSSFAPPRRPPQLCQGCPHADSLAFIKQAASAFPSGVIHGDIGCYSLGALPPISAIETVVDMGASLGLARGSAEAGLVPSIGVIGDSTFYHSGITNLVDAVAHRTNVKIVVVDNGTTGMTGGQPTIGSSEHMRAIALAAGVAPEHVHVVRAHRADHEANVELMKRELAYEGVSVIIAFRECLEALKKARKA